MIELTKAEFGYFKSVEEDHHRLVINILEAKKLIRKQLQILEQYDHLDEGIKAECEFYYELIKILEGKQENRIGVETE